LNQVDCDAPYILFIGNFVFSLADHAGNGFFRAEECVPVVASAIAIGFLVVPLLMRISRPYIDLCAAVLVLELAVGPWGGSLLLGREISASRPHLQVFLQRGDLN